MVDIQGEWVCIMQGWLIPAINLILIQRDRFRVSDWAVPLCFYERKLGYKYTQVFMADKPGVSIKQCKVCLKFLPYEMMDLKPNGNIREKICRDCRKIKLRSLRAIYPGGWKQKPYRRYRKDSCSRCGFEGLACQLDVHHIDQNHKNNDPSNLETMCANCHRLQTWKEKQENK